MVWHVCVVFSQISLIAAGDVRARARLPLFAWRAAAEPLRAGEPVSATVCTRRTRVTRAWEGAIHLYLVGITVPSPGLYAYVCTYINVLETPTAKRLRMIRGGKKRNKIAAAENR